MTESRRPPRRGRGRRPSSETATDGGDNPYRDDAESGKDKEDESRVLPRVEEGETLELVGILTEQHFTEPPPRYSEASLVKALEEYDIGRPSTYASIISTLLNREYVILESRRFYATDIGRIVNKFLTQHFTQYVDYEFTAKLEDQLDARVRHGQDGQDRRAQRHVESLCRYRRPQLGRCRQNGR